jgi:hypothetical protein
LVTGSNALNNGTRENTYLAVDSIPWIRQDEIKAAEFVPPPPPPPPAPVVPKRNCGGHLLPIGTHRELGRQMTIAYGWGGYWTQVDQIAMHESGWQSHACNPTSFACGIGQSLPCSKSTYQTPQGQVTWFLNYIKARYGNPVNAWNFWLAHRWY